MSKTDTNYIASSKAIFVQYKKLGEKAMAQVQDEDLLKQINANSNSIYLIVKHLHGNMLSRWTDFLTSDGEKTWRNRDNEFLQEDNMNREKLMQLWEEGWKCLFDTLDKLTPENLGNIVTIRGEKHSVMEAINRQVAHYSYHIGQIVFVCKIFQSDAWQTLSIAKGKSQEFNNAMQEKKEI